MTNKNNLTILPKTLRRLLCSNFVINNYILPKTDVNKKIFLTFDDGPSHNDNKYTLNLLTLLEQYNVRATFFVVGKQLLRHPEIATEIVKKGHRLANHTNTHKETIHLSFNKIDEEIKTCQHLINSFQPGLSLLYRPPRGLLNFKTAFYLLRKKYKPVLWQIDSKDSHDWGKNQIINYLKPKNVTNKIILFHDDHNLSKEVLNELIPYWQKQKYQFSLIP